MKILIIDDHIAIQRGLENMLRDEFPDIEITGAADAKTAVEQVRDAEWNLVLCDVNLPGRNGIEVVKEIKFAKPALPVLMLSMHPEEQFAMRALRAGALGYLTKTCEPEELIAAVKAVCSGKRYITPTLAEQLAQNMMEPGDKQPHERLSDREFEVFRLLASGKEVKEAAADLGLSVKTISTHRENILRKMQMKNNAALTVYAVKNGLIE